MICQRSKAWEILNVFAICLTLWNGNQAAANNALNQNKLYSIQTGDDYCFLMQFNMRLDLTYTKKDDTMGTQSFENLTLVSDPSSKCELNTTTLTLNGKPTKATDNWILTFKFTKRNDSNISQGTFQGSLIELRFFTDPQVFPETKIQEWITIRSNGTWGKTALGAYYHCMAPQTVNLEEAGKKGQIRLSDLKVQAFMLSKEAKFSENENLCTADQTPDNTVPIAVGIALAICILIALIVFIVFNRRNRRNYGSV